MDVVPLVHPVVDLVVVAVVVGDDQRDELDPPVQGSLIPLRLVHHHLGDRIPRGDPVGHVVPHQVIARHPVAMVVHPDRPVPAVYGVGVRLSEFLDAERLHTRPAVELHGRPVLVVVLHVTAVDRDVEARPLDLRVVGKRILLRCLTHRRGSHERVVPQPAGDGAFFDGLKRDAAHVLVGRRRCGHHGQ